MDYPQTLLFGGDGGHCCFSSRRIRNKEGKVAYLRRRFVIQRDLRLHSTAQSYRLDSGIAAKSIHTLFVNLVTVIRVHLCSMNN